MSGAAPSPLLEAALTALLTASGVGPDGRGETNLALPIHAEGADLASVFVELGRSLADGLSEMSLAIGSIRIDGLLRADAGFTAWGYALGCPATMRRRLASIAAATVESSPTGALILHALLRRDPDPSRSACRHSTPVDGASHVW